MGEWKPVFSNSKSTYRCLSTDDYELRMDGMLDSSPDGKQCPSFSFLFRVSIPWPGMDLNTAKEIQIQKFRIVHQMLSRSS